MSNIQLGEIYRIKVSQNFTIEFVTLGITGIDPNKNRYSDPSIKRIIDYV